MTETTHEDQQSSPHLPIKNNLKIALFHLGSGMADVITAGVWNRIMITDLGFAATPISLLVGLRYFLAPLGVWAGRISDERAVGGYRRLFWIWLGRLMMVTSILGTGLLTADLARGREATPMVWLLLTGSLLLFSLGSALSGSTFLALIYDRAHPRQRGRAVGIVWTFLLLGFTIAGILFGVLLPSNREEGSAAAGGLSFSPETLQTLFVVGALVMGALWFFSLLGEERRSTGTAAVQAEPKSQTTLRQDIQQAWSNRQTRFFFWYLALSMIFAFAQDLVLEPFAGDVFNMDAAHTTRFAAYWGSMSIIGTVLFLWLSRRYTRLTNTVMSHVGVWVLVATFAVFALSSVAEIRGLVTPGLILLGIGLGVWNVGTLGMMMEMSPFGRAGTFLGFWTLVVTLARGFGVTLGGFVRDIAVQLTGNVTLSYGVVFGLEAIGLIVALWALSQVNVQYFQAEQGEAQSDATSVLAAALD
ncbi:MAG: BCD family MFS transporter [Anaerolineaceae bacterium]|nr:BCD family MFS transporter [Anaerolineaceae bacterium]